MKRKKMHIKKNSSEKSTTNLAPGKDDTLELTMLRYWCIKNNEMHMSDMTFHTGFKRQQLFNTGWGLGQLEWFKVNKIMSTLP